MFREQISTYDFLMMSSCSVSPSLFIRSLKSLSLALKSFALADVRRLRREDTLAYFFVNC